MKSLFHFKGQECSYEIFADSYFKAHEELTNIMGDKSNVPLRLQFVTQNYNCPKCGCHASECNYDN